MVYDVVIVVVFKDAVRIAYPYCVYQMQANTLIYSLFNVRYIFHSTGLQHPGLHE